MKHVKISNNSKQPRKYAIFVCGPHLDNPIGDYGDMIIDLLKTENDGIQFVKFDVYSTEKNELPSFNDIINNNFDGIIVSGSRYDAHCNDKWVVNLRKLIRLIYDYKLQKIKIVGICFGHQVIAHALNGGLAGRNNKTIWEIGVKNMKLTNSFYQLFGSDNPKIKNLKSINILETHRDAVLSLPNNAKLLAYSEFTDIEMYCVDNQIFSMQGHPEFNKDYVKSIISVKKDDKSVPKTEIKYALQSLKDTNPDNDLLKLLILEFLKL